MINRSINSRSVGGKRITPCTRGFRVIAKSNNCTYGPKKNGLSYFYPKRKVLSDGYHTKPVISFIVFKSFHIILLSVYKFDF